MDTRGGSELALTSRITNTFVLTIDWTSGECIHATTRSVAWIHAWGWGWEHFSPMSWVFALQLKQLNAVIASVEIAWTCLASIWFFFILPPLESIPSLLDTYTFTTQWCHISYTFCCLVGHISVRKDILMSLRLFSWINKEYTKLNAASSLYQICCLWLKMTLHHSWEAGLTFVWQIIRQQSVYNTLNTGNHFLADDHGVIKKYPTPNMRTVFFNFFFFYLFVFFGDETVREYRPEEESVV